MAWQLIFKAPDDEVEGSILESDDSAPVVRKPVSVKIQLEPGTMVVVGAGDDDDDD